LQQYKLEELLYRLLLQPPAQLLQLVVVLGVCMVVEGRSSSSSKRLPRAPHSVFLLRVASQPLPALKVVLAGHWQQPWKPPQQQQQGLAYQLHQYQSSSSSLVLVVEGSGSS
jgi:hypothetical protein